jgi:hypothetical protein
MRLLLLCTLTVAALPLAPLHAQSDWLPIPVEEPRRIDRRPYVGEWHYGIDGGFANFLPTQFNERGTRFQLFAERQLHPWVALQASGDCSRGSRPLVPGNPQEFVSLCSGVVGAVVPIPLHPRVWPYLRAGYGLALWDDFAAEGFFDPDEYVGTAVVGFGLRSYFNNRQTIGMRIDAQRQQTTLYGDPVTHWSFGVGLSLRMLPR